MAPRKSDSSSEVQKTLVSRWGSPILDDYNWVTLPGWILRHYHRCGVSAMQMMFIVHIMSFHYDRPSSTARPSLATIATCMGRDIKSVRRLKNDLIRKGLLHVTSRPGQPDEYNFKGLVNRCLQYEMESEFSTSENQPLPKMGGVPLPKMGGEDLELKDQESIPTPNGVGANAPPAAFPEPEKPIPENPNPAAPPVSLESPHGYEIVYSHGDSQAHLIRAGTKHPTKCAKCHAPLGTWSQTAAGRSYPPCCDWQISDPSFSPAIKECLASICKKSWAIKTNEKAMRAALATISRHEPVTQEKLQRFKENWYRCDFRGRRGSPPEPYQVAQMWVAYTEKDPCSEGQYDRERSVGHYQRRSEPEWLTPELIRSYEEDWLAH